MLLLLLTNTTTNDYEPAQWLQVILAVERDAGATARRAARGRRGVGGAEHLAWGEGVGVLG